MQGSVCKSLAYLASLNLEIRKRRKLLTNIINGAAVTAKLAKMVSFDTRGAQFEPSHQLFLYRTCVFSQLYGKDENKEKRGREGSI